MDKEQLAELSAKVLVNNESTEALRLVVWQLMEELHRKGIIRMQEIADNTERSAAFSKAAFNKSQPQFIETLATALRDIGDALDKNA